MLLNEDKQLVITESFSRQGVLSATGNVDFYLLPGCELVSCRGLS